MGTVPFRYRFSVLSSRNEKNRILEAADADVRTHAGKIRQQALESKPDRVIAMLKDAVKAGINADYVLMDTWFTAEPLLHKIKELGLDAIGMVKQLKQRYFLNGQACSLDDLLAFVKKSAGGRFVSDFIGSVCVKTKNGLDVKIVFIVNCNNRSESLAILTTDLSLTEQEIVQYYALRFNIEGLFFNAKHCLHLTAESQCRMFDSTAAFCALGILRLIIVEWIVLGRRNPNTKSGLTFIVAEEELQQPFEKAVCLIFECLKQIAAVLVQRGLMKKKDQQAAEAVIMELFWDKMNESCSFIREFVRRSFDKAEQQAYESKKQSAKQELCGEKQAAAA